MNIIYAKKMLLPSPAANILQSLNMCNAFCEAGAKVTYFPSIVDGLIEEILANYGIKKTSELNNESINLKHKGLYGLLFRYHLLKHWVKKGGVFYARDIKEASFIYKLSKKLGKKHRVYYEMHEVLSVQHKIFGTGKSDYYHDLEKKVLESIDGLVVINEKLNTMVFEEYNIQIPSICAPMGYNPKIFAPVREKVKKDHVEIVYAGSLHDNKGVLDLVKSVELLPDSWCVKIIGANPSSKYASLKSEAKKYGSHRIKFYGQLTLQEVGKIVSKADVIVIPQRGSDEFFSPIKLYESLATGVPIVVTNLPIFDGIIKDGENAFFAEPCNPKSLAEAIIKAVKDKDLAHKIRLNNVKLSSSLTWKERASKIIEFMSD